jgi:hypothetical protein
VVVVVVVLLMNEMAVDLFDQHHEMNIVIVLINSNKHYSLL